MTNWADLAPEDLVLGKDKHTWKIDKIAPVSVFHAGVKPGTYEVTLSRAGAKPFTGRVSGQVQAVWTASQEIERAEALVQVRLGGETVARKGPNGVYLAPAAFADPGALLSHAYIFHGATGDGQAALADLRKWHDELHLKPEGEPHHHDPDFYKANR